mmetsp:Transcript_49461/g.141792  ORF Transcript_49461/g.141792 Transcript_49461/m.141792 type:complete len:275 (-) Transcript_49461:299-1123(-)
MRSRGLHRSVGRCDIGGQILDCLASLGNVGLQLLNVPTLLCKQGCRFRLRLHLLVHLHPLCCLFVKCLDLPSRLLGRPPPGSRLGPGPGLRLGKGSSSILLCVEVLLALPARTTACSSGRGSPGLYPRLRPRMFELGLGGRGPEAGLGSKALPLLQPMSAACASRQLASPGRQFGEWGRLVQRRCFSPLPAQPRSPQIAAHLVSGRLRRRQWPPQQRVRRGRRRGRRTCRAQVGSCGDGCRCHSQAAARGAWPRDWPARWPAWGPARLARRGVQ